MYLPFFTSACIDYSLEVAITGIVAIFAHRASGNLY